MVKFVNACVERSKKFSKNLFFVHTPLHFWSVFQRKSNKMTGRKEKGKSEKAKLKSKIISWQIK